MESKPKYFTPESANKTLPLVRKIVEDILRCGQDIRACSNEPIKEKKNAEIQRLMEVLDGLFDELEALGCFYKDWNFSQGLVDFPAILNKKEVFLCWRNDEKEVMYYHEIDAGFSARKRIPQKK